MGRRDQEQRARHDAWQDTVRVMVVVAVMALVVWALCAALRWAVHAGTDALHHYLLVHADELHAPALLLGVLVAGGLVAGALMRLPGWGQTSGDGIDVALAGYHGTYQRAGDALPALERPALATGFSAAIQKLVTTALTLGTGGSGGLVGPMVVVGEAVGAGWTRVVRARSAAELRTYQLAGMAAAVATLLGTPFAAALFAVEIAYRDRIIYRKIPYALLASMVAYVLDRQLLGTGPLFEAPPHAYVYTVTEYGIAALVAVAVAAPLAVGFGRLVGRAGVLVSRVDPIWRVGVGALGCGLVAVGLWKGMGIAPYHVLGMGENTLNELLAPGAQTTWGFLLAALAGKMLATGFTVGAGGSAGLLIPSMFFGGVSGLLVAKLLEAAGLPVMGAEPAIFLVVGMAAALVAVIGVPLAAVALVLEVFGPQYGPPAALACGVTWALTLRIEVYGAQRRSPDPDGDETGSMGPPLLPLPPAAPTSAPSAPAPSALSELAPSAPSELAPSAPSADVRASDDPD
jgi:CIC family chloride channel protein